MANEPTTTYEIGVSGTAFTGAGVREDLMDIITILSPVDAPLFTMLRKAKITNVATEWLTDTLDEATANAAAEGSDPTYAPGPARVRLLNYAQIVREPYHVSDTMRAVLPAGIRDEYRYQMTRGMKQWKRDTEYTLVNGNTASAASTRNMRGMYAWLSGFSTQTALIANSATNSAQNLQEDDLNGVLQNIWTIGGLPDYVLCTPTQKKAVSTNFAGSANSRRTAPLSDNSVTNVIDWYYSDFGNVKILPHRWFASAAPAGAANVQRLTFAITSDKWVLGILRPPKAIPLAKTGSAEKGMIEGELTLICLHPSANAFISGHASGTFRSNFPAN